MIRTDSARALPLSRSTFGNLVQPLILSGASRAYKGWSAQPHPNPLVLCDSHAMKQMSLASAMGSGFERRSNKTRKREFLE